MTTKSKLVCPQNISTYYCDEKMSEQQAQEIIQAEKAKKNRVITLVAEKVGEGKYMLIEKFGYYGALLKREPYTRVPLLVYPATSDIERLIHILKVSIPLENNTSWLFKNHHVMRLIQEHNVTANEISNRTGLDLQKIIRYIPDNRIPVDIWERALQMNAKGVVWDICRSTVIPNEAKSILYEHAILEKGNAKRLNGTKFALMKTFFSSCHLPDYLLMDTPRLEKLINQLIVTNFELESHMMNVLNSFLDEELGPFYRGA